MVSNIYQLAEDLRVRYNQTYPEKFETWSSTLLDDFDTKKTGSTRELQKERANYVEKLKRDYANYKAVLLEKRRIMKDQFQKALEDTFIDYPGSLICPVPQSIKDRIYIFAHEYGHSSGFPEVAKHYSCISEIVLSCIRDYTE